MNAALKQQHVRRFAGPQCLFNNEREHTFHCMQKVLQPSKCRCCWELDSSPAIANAHQQQHKLLHAVAAQHTMTIIIKAHDAAPPRVESAARLHIHTCVLVQLAHVRWFMSARSSHCINNLNNGARALLRGAAATVCATAETKQPRATIQWHEIIYKWKRRHSRAANNK